MVGVVAEVAAEIPRAAIASRQAATALPHMVMDQPKSNDKEYLII
jgi:hypothetical protein